MISRKNQLQKNKPSLQTLLSKKTSLIQARTLAQKRHDYAEADKIKLELEQLEEAHADMIGSRPQQVDRFGAVNERNRQANLDAVRANEEAEKERRKKAAVGAAAMNAGHIGGSPAPAVVDLSARVRTLPKIRHEVTSRLVVGFLPCLGFIYPFDHHLSDYFFCCLYQIGCFSCGFLTQVRHTEASRIRRPFSKLRSTPSSIRSQPEVQF